MSLRRIQPSACKAKATRHGMPSKLPGGKPLIFGRLVRMAHAGTSPFSSVVFLPTLPPPPHLSVLQYEPPKFKNHRPSSLSTRYNSRPTATILAMYCSGESSKPIWSSTRVAPHFLHLLLNCCTLEVNAAFDSECPPRFRPNVLV